jgi:hypothetical protein
MQQDAGNPHILAGGLAFIELYCKTGHPFQKVLIQVDQVDVFRVLLEQRTEIFHIAGIPEHPTLNAPQNIFFFLERGCLEEFFPVLSEANVREVMFLDLLNFIKGEAKLESSIRFFLQNSEDQFKQFLVDRLLI